ncbi:LysR family transcriptional regulator [Marinobacter bohaiensis]|uniref:LysR family transcriptional regulator n=1 Tax=Marinobacter bohaiensis TaxID=2201898 RepID=UPI000DABAD81|nr:LysR family transcriptional regulator [Marinobacter bohaiensis]
MKIDFFITLQKVIETGSFAMAAREVHVTPSAVSMQIKSLEKYFGQALFHRTGQNVQPTLFALELSTNMAPVVKYLVNLKNGNASFLEGSIKLGIVGLMQPIVLPGLFMKLRERGHKITINCIPGRSQKLIESVKTGELDGAVVAEPEMARRKQLEWNLIRDEPFYLITPEAVIYDGDPSTLAELPWVGYDRASMLGKLSRKIADEYFQAPAPAIELQSLQAVTAMVSSGFGAAVVIVPDGDMDALAGVNVFPLDDAAPTIRFSLVTRKVESRNVMLEEVRRCILPATK